MQEVRTVNRIFDGKTLSEFFINYGEAVAEASQTIDAEDLNRIFVKIEQLTKSGATVFVAGNGGSAAISEHLCCDWSKGTDLPGLPPIRTLSLSANVPLITALANDLGYETIFSKQLNYLARPGDVLLLISSSGNSPNIIEAAIAAKAQAISVIGFVGFSGGKLKALADLCVHVNYPNYGIVEDVHQMLMHSIAQLIIRNRENR